MMILSFLRIVLILGRISNLPTIWTNIAVGWFLSGGDWAPELGWITLGMSLIYVGGMTLNDAFDAEWDRENATSRPIPSGRISLRAVWSLGSVEMLAGFLILLQLTGIHLLFISLLVLAVFLYNWLHKRWSGSVLIMGACRALVYLGAASAAVAQINGVPIPAGIFMIAFLVVIYIAGLTLAARSEHLATAKEIGFLPRLMLTAPVILPLIGSRMVSRDIAHYALIGLGVVGVWSWIVILRRALRERVPTGIAFAIAGIAFYDAFIVAFSDWRAAIACLICFVLTLAAQRVIPAT